MQFDLVDQHDRFGGERVVEMGIALRHAPSEIGRQRQHDATASAQLIQSEIFSLVPRLHGYDETERPKFDTRVRYSANHAHDRLTNGVQVLPPEIEVAQRFLLS